MTCIYDFFLISEFLQCIKRLYNCQNAGISKQNCQNVELCVQPVEAENEGDESRPVSGEYLPPVGSQDSQSSSNIGGLRPPFNPTVSSTFTTTQTTQTVSKPTNRKSLSQS